MSRARNGAMHPRAKLRQSDVDLIRHMHEEEGKGYRWLARKFELGKTTVRKICNYQTWVPAADT